MIILKKVARVFIPRPLRRFLRAQHRNYIFWRAMKRFLRDPEDLITTQTNDISKLIYGWGNEGWSALEEFLLYSLKRALECNGPILECGSGLTTILLGVIAQRSGNTVWSLEQHQVWGERVSKYLKKYGIHSVHLCVNNLQDYGNFSWYSPPLESMPDMFSLVVCDGPPGNTRGGRYGLLPVMKPRLAPGSVILLDDAAREQERVIATRWARELNTSYEMHSSAKPFIQITVPKTGEIQ